MRTALTPQALVAPLRALPRRALRATRWLVLYILRQVPAVAAGVAASIPVIVSTVHGVQAGWEPDGDDGIILTRALDVFTNHSPLIGQYSEAGDVTGQIVHSAGPMLYWLLAIPVRLGGPASAAIAMGVLNCVCMRDARRACAPPWRDPPDDRYRDRHRGDVPVARGGGLSRRLESVSRDVPVSRVDLPQLVGRGG